MLTDSIKKARWLIVFVSVTHNGVEKIQLIRIMLINDEQYNTNWLFILANLYCSFIHQRISLPPTCLCLRPCYLFKLSYLGSFAAFAPRHHSLSQGNLV